MMEMEEVGLYYQKERLVTTSFTNTAMCKKCNSCISRGVEFRSTIWHRECFTCSNCPELLAGTKFISEDGRPYCFQCYGALFAYKCAACTMPIYGVGDGFLIHMSGQHWHVMCFKCDSCGRHLLGELSVCNASGLHCVGCQKKQSF